MARLSFPSGWYKSSEWWTGFAALSCAGMPAFDIIPHGHPLYRWCLFGSFLFGGVAVVTSQVTTATAEQKSAPADVARIRDLTSQVAHMSGDGMAVPVLPPEPPKVP